METLSFGQQDQYVPSFISDTPMILRDCDHLIYQLEAYNTSVLVIGQESIVSSVIDNISGIFIRIVGNLKAMLRMFSDFKRAELVYYCEAHVTRVKRAFALDFDQVKNLQVPIPRGMMSTYKQAIIPIANCLNALNIRTRTRASFATVNEIYGIIQKSNPVLLNQFLATNKSNDTTEVDRTFAAVNAVFTNKPTSTVKFSQAYFDMGEFKAVNQDLINMETHLFTVSDTFNQMDSIEKVVDDIVTVLRNVKDSFNPKVIVELATHIRALAVMFETYGLVINDLNRLVHNQVEVHECIRKATKL